MPEQFADLAQTTLASSINSSVTSITVSDGSSFPSSGTYSIIIDSEIMTVTARSGNTLTVTRNEFGGAASHTAGATVVCVLTARALRQFQQDMTLSGTLGSRPSAAYQGRLYLPSDSPYIYRDNGVSWDAYGPARKVTPIVTSNFAWVNQGGATVTSNGDALTLVDPAVASDHHRLYVQSITGSFTVTMLCAPYIFADNNQFGLVLYESGSGKLLTHGYNHFTSATWLQSNYWSNTSTYVATVFQQQLVNFAVPPTWLRIRVSSGTIFVDASTDGYQWRQLGSVAVTTAFTTAPDHCGIFANSSGTNADAGGTVYHYAAG